MRFEEVMCSLKNEDLEKICFVENGTFYITIGADARFLNEVLGLEKVCFKNGICKVGFPCSSLDKYVDLFENKKIPYVVYGYVEDKENVVITSEEKAWSKIKESNFCNKMVYEIVSTVDFSCGKCSYKRKRIITDILSYEKRILRLKKELRLLDKTYECKEEISLFDALDGNSYEK